MKLGTILKKGLLGLAIAAGAASAYAIPSFGLSGTGPIEIKFTGFTAPSAAGGAGAFGSGLESTFGAGYVGDIHDANNSSNIFWQPGNATGSMSYMLWGMADDSAVPDGVGGFNLYNSGCTIGPFCDGKIHITFYLDDTTAMGGTNPGFAGGGSVSPASRIGNTLGGLTDATMIMDWILVPGAVFGDPTTTLFQHVSGITLPATGNGSFYAECASGPACPTFSQAGMPDFFGVFTLTDNSGTSSGGNGWLGRIADPVVGVAVPEPTTVLLFAAGLLGLASAARRRKF